MMLRVIEQEFGVCGADRQVGGSWKVLGVKRPSAR